LLEKIVTTIKDESAIDDEDEEEFLYLVCEWIDWSQDISSNLNKIPTPKSIGQGSNDDEFDKKSLLKEGSGGEETSCDKIGNDDKTSDDDKGVVKYDVENPMSTKEKYTEAPLESMVNPEERKWFEQYIHYMGSTPRRMIRISNIYNISRILVEATFSRDSDRFFNQKLLKITILCEQWPYRMSLLIKSAEVMLRKSLNEIKKMKDMSLVSFKFEKLELKFVRKSKCGNEYGILCDTIEEKRKKFNLKAKKIQSDLKVKTNDVKGRIKIVYGLREHEELITELESLSVEINNVYVYWGGNNKYDVTKN